MSSRRSHLPVDRSEFAGFRFPPEVITVAVRWYLRVRHEALFDREEMKGLLRWAVAAVH
jgi:transposase-like protein